MQAEANEERVDALIKYFWKSGYLTISRRFGTYLPEPKPVGKYNVDAIGKYKKKFVIGITLTPKELDDPKLFSKLDYLATRHTKYAHKKVTLFVGVPQNYLNKAKMIVSNFPEEVQKNIKLVTLPASLNSKDN